MELGLSSNCNTFLVSLLFFLFFSFFLIEVSNSIAIFLSSNYYFCYLEANKQFKIWATVYGKRVLGVLAMEFLIICLIQRTNIDFYKIKTKLGKSS